MGVITKGSSSHDVGLYRVLGGAAVFASKGLTSVSLLIPVARPTLTRISFNLGRLIFHKFNRHTCTMLCSVSTSWFKVWNVSVFWKQLSLVDQARGITDIAEP